MAGPPSEASLHALVDKADAAVEKSRFARADLFKRAALQASALFPHDSLILTQLHYLHAGALQGQARQPGVSLAEQRVLHEEAWARVREGTEVVSRRHASDTLGRNKCRPDEVQYVTPRLSSECDFYAAQLADLGSNVACMVGVSVAIRLARLCLCRLHCVPCGIPLPPLAAPEHGRVEQFVFLTLDYLATTRAVTFPIYGEVELVQIVRQLLARPVHTTEHSFRNALEARWTSPDMVAGFRRRGTLERSFIKALVDDVCAGREAAQRSDVAEHGLLVCAFPGCDKREVTVREFKVCSACWAVAYCSAEHGGLHWAGDHKHECKDLKAAGAKPARAT